MSDQKKFDRKPNRPFPRHTLEEVLVIAETIQDKNNGKPMKRLLLANAINRKPTGVEFRDLLSSSFKYGLTNGTEKAENIDLTELGKKLTKPTSEKEKYESLQKAILTPEVFQRIYVHYKNGKFQTGQFFENALGSQFNIPKEYTKEVVKILEKNGRHAGIIRDISGSPHILFEEYPQDETPQKSDYKTTGITNSEIDYLTEQKTDTPKTDTKITHPKESPSKENGHKPIFLGHGKNQKPVEQLIKILEKFKIPYKVAGEEPNSGRPISQKVRETMNECGSAILIFSNDGTETDTIPNLNVVFELGAASVLYGEKVVIFKEDGIKLPSDFSDIGHISFEKDKLNTKALELLNELIAMGFIKVLPA